VNLQSLEDTKQLAHYLVQHLPAGSLLLLSGPLGAGKTTLTQQLALALGSSATVSSPTYTLIHEYPTPLGLLVHIDAYRLPGAEALLELGLEDYLDRARLVVVEWGEALKNKFPEAVLLELAFSNTGRIATLHLPEGE
jgi:tRNA threonylcarbamoyladenosine biosynthesis protein TsaE